MLPCSLMLEQEDIVESYLHDYVHHVEAVQVPPGQCKSDYWILSQLGSLLDPPVELPNPDGKYRFPTELHDEQAPPAGFPFRLLTLIRREVIHSQILPEKHHSVPTVWVAPDHPGLPDLDLARDVFLCSPLGRIRMRVEMMPGLHPEVVLYRRGDWMKLGGGANQLIKSGLTDLGRCAPFYEVFVKLANT